MQRCKVQRAAKAFLLSEVRFLEGGGPDVQALSQNSAASGPSQGGCSATLPAQGSIVTVGEWSQQPASFSGVFP